MTLPARYPAPHAEQIFSERAKIARWAEWTRKFLEMRLKAVSNNGETLMSEYLTTPLPSPDEVRAAERETGHDLVAFLAVLTDDMSRELKKHIHYGLTSSDIVDNAHFDALHRHTSEMLTLVGRLQDRLRVLQDKRPNPSDTVRVGRTHGQVAALTTLEHQIDVHVDALISVYSDMNHQRKQFMKSIGPTGTLNAFRTEATGLNRRIVPSTQIVHRDYQLRWAALYLRLACILENLAQWVRAGARSEVEEFREGAVRVGSSAMPHKSNPIDCEKVCGMARLARGYFITIAETTATWDDRDISNSSVERVAVVDLAATVEHMTNVMTEVIRNLHIDYDRIAKNLYDHRTASFIHQSMAQERFGLGPVEASRLVRRHVSFRKEGISIDATEIMRDFDLTLEEVRAWSTASYRMWSESTRIVP